MPLARPLLALVTLLALGAPQASAEVVAASGAAAEARVSRDGAEVRATEGFAGEIVGRPSRGDTVRVLERLGAFRRVRLSDGREGFLHEHFLDERATAAAPVAAPAATPPAAAPVQPAPAAPPPVAPAPQPVPVSPVATRPPEPVTWREELAVMRTELGVATVRAEAAERSLAKLQARLDAAEAALAAAEAESSLRAAAGDESLRRELASAVERADGEAARAAELEAAAEAARSRAGQLEQDLAAATLAHAEEIDRLDAEHQRLINSYVEIVTVRHEDALARDRAAAAADCERRLVEERREMDRRLRAARRETGWEVEFEKELGARLVLAAQEIEARVEARHRGQQYDEARVRREEEARVRKACESERLAAVQATLSQQATDCAGRLARAREEADTRCQLALEVVLERAAAGEDLTAIREFARERTRRPEAAP